MDDHSALTSDEPCVVGFDGSTWLVVCRVSDGRVRVDEAEISPAWVREVVAGWQMPEPVEPSWLPVPISWPEVIAGWEASLPPKIEWSTS